MKKILTLATVVLLVTSVAFAHGDDKKKDKACCKKENKECCAKDKEVKKEAKAADKTAKPATKKAA
jgi:hypothetical protein